MCLIIDTSVAGLVLGQNASPTGSALLARLNSARTKVVVGGKLKDELSGDVTVLRWIGGALQSGRAYGFCDVCVKTKTEAVRSRCKSNDAHVIALAQVSKCRMLYANDRDLERDFRDRRLVNTPRGFVLPLNLEPRRVASTVSQQTRNCAGYACRDMLPRCPH